MPYNLCILVNKLENVLKIYIKKFNHKIFHIHFFKIVKWKVLLNERYNKFASTFWKNFIIFNPNGENAQVNNFQN